MKKQLLNLLFIVSLFSSVITLHAEWQRWPDEGEASTNPSIAIPDGFRKIRPLVPEPEEPALINARVRSPDGAVEFAVLANSARGMPPTIESRKLNPVLREGERITKSSTTSEVIESDYGDYLHYTEHIVVQGPDNAYTRYFRIQLSTGNLAGASTVLWEFLTKDEKSRKEYQATYQRFFEEVDFGEF